MYFCMASRRCGIGVVGWYVGTLGTGICGTEHPNNSTGSGQSQYALQPDNVDLCDLSEKTYLNSYFNISFKTA